MDALAAGVDEGGTGQFQLLDDSLLLAKLHVVALHKGVAISGDVGVLAAGAVHGVEADPRANLRVAVAHNLAEISAALVQLGDELPGGAVPATFCGAAAVVCHEALGDVSHILVRLEQRPQVALELVGWIPLFRQCQLVGFHPARVHHTAFRLCACSDSCGDVVVPVQRMARRAAPSVGVGHLEDAAYRDRRRPAAVEALPFFDALALVVAACVPGAPLLPDRDRHAAVLQRHAHRDPLVIGQGGRAEKFQRFFEIIFMFHSRYHPKSGSGMGGCGAGV